MTRCEECGRPITGEVVRTATRTLDRACADRTNAIAYGVLNGGNPFDGPGATRAERERESRKHAER